MPIAYVEHAAVVRFNCRESRIHSCLREHGLAGKALSLAVAPIHGSSGFRAGLSSSSTRSHDVTKLDRALQSAIAGFASLALQ